MTVMRSLVVGQAVRLALWGYGLGLGLVNPAMAAAEPPALPSLHLLVLGDSLTAGYNLPAEDAFPVHLEAALRSQGYAVQVINGGVSGDTSADGRARLDWALGDGTETSMPTAVVVELGANDALRGIDPALTYANLDAILTALQTRHIKILLAGMKAPPNLGADYGRTFDAIYPRLQMQHGVPLYPFFLDGVALHPERMLGDGMHPNRDGVLTMVHNILPYVDALLGPPAALRGVPR
jgi:acyl-CoA thioesterase-1